MCTLGFMAANYPEEVQYLIKDNKNVISRAQWIDARVNERRLDTRVQSGQMMRLHRGVYATVSGRLEREAELRAALLRAGTDAILSHWTAAEVHGLLDREWPTIHITVPECRNPARCRRIDGVVVHRSDVTIAGKHPSRTLPCTRVEDTVVDLIHVSPTFDAAYDWICRAVGRRRTTTDRVLEVVQSRKRVRWGREVKITLDVAAGALSWLELRYVNGVEIPHGLPTALRQERVRQETGNKYLDNLYEEYRACMELDGIIAHPEDEQQRDRVRDRQNLVVRGIITMRFGTPDLISNERLCMTGAEVAKALSDRGPGVGHPCTRPACTVPDTR